jgi:molybdate transport system substrate-binding protein
MGKTVFGMRSRTWAVGLTSLVVGWALGGCGRPPASAPGSPPSGQLQIYIPCGYWLPLTQIKARFEKQFPAAQIELKADPYGKLIRQLPHQEDWPDLVICPGQVEMNLLIQRKIVRRADRHAVGQYDILLYVPRDNPGQIKKIEDLARPSVQHVALSDPRTSSMGFFVQQSLEQLGLWAAVERKIVRVNTWRQGYKKILNKEIEASFAYNKCPIDKQPGDSLAYRVIGPLPVQNQEPMLLEIGLTTRSKQRALGEAFIEFLLRDEIQAILPEIGLISRPMAGLDRLEFLSLTDPQRPPSGALSFPALPQPMGSPQARVFIYAVIAAGEECQEQVKERLIHLGEAYPDQTFIYFANTNAGGPGAPPGASSEGIPPLEKFGRKVPQVAPPYCGFVCLNGKMEMTLPAEGNQEEKEVTFSGPPGEDELFTLEDLERAIKREILAQYGKIAPPPSLSQDLPATPGEEP